jgi:membrane protein YdbS with pleckstrin-like domain
MAQTIDPAQTDLSWRGYSGWAMLPSIIVCGAMSITLLTGSWFSDEMRLFGQEAGRFIFFAITFAIWAGLLLPWFYRGATYIYRLTPQYLFLDRGFLYGPQPPIELAKVARVDWGSNALCRFFGVGRVVVGIDDAVPITLPGIWRPAAFAEEIEAAVNKLKGMSKDADRLPKGSD